MLADRCNPRSTSKGDIGNLRTEMTSSLAGWRDSWPDSWLAAFVGLAHELAGETAGWLASSRRAGWPAQPASRPSWLTSCQLGGFVGGPAVYAPGLTRVSPEERVQDSAIRTAAARPESRANPPPLLCTHAQKWTGRLRPRSRSASRQLSMY